MTVVPQAEDGVRQVLPMEQLPLHALLHLIGGGAVVAQGALLEGLQQYFQVGRRPPHFKPGLRP